MKNRKTHWAEIGENGSQLGMHLLLGAYKIGGRPLFKLLLFPVVLFYTLSSPLAREASVQYRRYMHAINPDFPTPAFGHSFKHMWLFANTLLDKLAVWMGDITRRDVTVHNAELIDRLMEEKRGAVLLISHLGNFEICQALSENRSELRLTVLHHTLNAEKFNHILKRQNRHSGVEFMQVNDLDINHAMRISEHLSDGRLVAISADRVAVSNPRRTVTVPFLGHPAKFPTGPFILAMALQVPVITVQCIAQAGRYHIYFEQLEDGSPCPRKNKQERLNRLIRRYVTNLQTHCLQAPWQWYNFYPYWQNQQTSEAGKQQSNGAT